MARNFIRIDQKEFENLCALQCTLKEITFFFRCSDDTIEKWCQRTYGTTFREVKEVKKQAGKIALRRAQFRMAEKNPTMNIFLSKQFLGMSDKQEIHCTGTVDTNPLKEMSIEELRALINQEKKE